MTNLLLFAFAYQLTIYKTDKFNRDHFSKFIKEEAYVRGVILQSPIEKERSYKIILNITGVRSGSEWIHTSGKSMIYIAKNESASKLKYGDQILLNAKFQPIPDIQNPGEFNYKRFLAFHNVYHQCSVSNGDWIGLGINSGSFILKQSYELRDNLLKILAENNIKEDEFAVGAALMLGYSDKLDQELISAYSSTGALHVLSVSGLHVAIVYVVFNWLLFFLDKVKRGNIIKAAVLILLLWFYSALTGLSPSVLRASTMFSFIIIAKAFDRYTNIYNTLAASAFVLLAIDPYLIMEVGFQLSYIAVIGIVYLQPKIYAWYEPDNRLIDQIWTITAVSIAAQTATFPLGLHYFHQFPNYFLLSNFIVIPVSTIVIYLGIALFTLYKLTFIAGLLAIGFSWSVWFLNASVKMIEKWPHALLNGISISILETWLLYGMIILFMFYFKKRKLKYVFYAFTMMILILCSQILEQYQQSNQRKLIIYNIPKTSAIDFISSRSSTLLTDSLFAQNESSQLFHVKHNWWDLGINKYNIITNEKGAEGTELIKFRNKNILIINKRAPLNYQKKKEKIDYLIISNNSDLKISQELKEINPGMIIFDSSNSRYKIRAWKEDCKKLGLNYYTVSESGAFETNL
jgi:competence protein ComEC